MYICQPFHLDSNLNKNPYTCMHLENIFIPSYTYTYIYNFDLFQTIYTNGSHKHLYAPSHIS